MKSLMSLVDKFPKGMLESALARSFLSDMFVYFLKLGRLSVLILTKMGVSMDVDDERQ